MKKLIIITLTILAAPLLALGQGGSGDTGYIPLEPLPGISTAGQPVNIDNFLQGLLTFGIGIAAALAVIMIIVGGFQYLSTDAWFQKSEGRQRILNAILGLLLAIGAWVILNTINPNLVNLSVTFDRPDIDFSSVIPTSGHVDRINRQCPARGPGGERIMVDCVCQNCTEIRARSEGSNIIMGTGLTANPHLQSALWDKLVQFRSVYLPQELAKNPAGFRTGGFAITEAWPPVVPHSNSCHLNGSCADIGIRGVTAHFRVIRAFITAGQRAGLRLVWEVPSIPIGQEAYLRNMCISNSGCENFGAGDILTLPCNTNVTPPSCIAPHFSVYHQ